MPLPAEAEELRERLAVMYEATQQQHIEELVRLATAPDPYGRIAVRRERIRELARGLDAALRQLDVSAAEWLDGDFPAIYRLGGEQGGLSFRWTAEHRNAVAHLADDTYDELLSATRFVRREVKAFIREAAKPHVQRAIMGSRTATAEGRALAQELADRGIAAVTYRDGARHGLGEYGSMVVRTKSALSYNAGTFQNGASHGVEWYECYDGAACGLTYHDDPHLANGLILPAAEAQANPIAHPNCARSWGPRPDVSSRKEAKAARRYTPAEQQAMAAEERARAARGPIVRTGPSDRTRRRDLTRSNRARRIELRRQGRGAPI